MHVQEVFFSGSVLGASQGHATAIEIVRGSVVTLPMKASFRFLALAACQHHHLGHAGQKW